VGRCGSDEAPMIAVRLMQ